MISSSPARVGAEEASRDRRASRAATFHGGKSHRCLFRDNQPCSLTIPGAVGTVGGVDFFDTTNYPIDRGDRSVIPERRLYLSRNRKTTYSRRMKKLERKMFGDVCCWFKTFIFLVAFLLVTVIAVFPFFVCTIVTRRASSPPDVLLFRQPDTFDNTTIESIHASSADDSDAVKLPFVHRCQSIGGVYLSWHRRHRRSGESPVVSETRREERLSARSRGFRSPSSCTRSS